MIALMRQASSQTASHRSQNSTARAFDRFSNLRIPISLLTSTYINVSKYVDLSRHAREGAPATLERSGACGGLDLKATEQARKLIESALAKR